MKSINRLRQFLEDQFGSERFAIHSYGYVQGMAIANIIEKEIAERYMELPVDADGEPIHMGDTVEGELVFDDVITKGTVTTYHIHDNDEPDTVYIKVDCGNGTWTIKELIIKRCHHVKPRTLEDVIEGAINTAFGNGASVSDIVKKSADEIREILGIMLGGDA